MKEDGPRHTRRELLRTGLAFGGGMLLQRAAPAFVPRRIGVPDGVQSGDVAEGRATIWARADAPGRLVVDWSEAESFQERRTVQGPAATAASDFTARVELTGLPPGAKIRYRVRFEDPSDPSAASEPVSGSFLTPFPGRDVLFAWSGDVCGQGWGIDPDRGGMLGWESMRRLEPEFFVHSGDTVYADVPLPREMPLPDGTLWRNLVTPAKAKVAETLEEFRGCHRYNRLDENLRRFSAEVPMVAQWDDHEVRNNWYPGQVLTDPAYKERRVDVLAARARQAFLEYHPIRASRRDPERIFRSYSRGPLLELFVLDERSFRARNSPNRQEREGLDTAFLGTRQVEWLKDRLRASRAVWKVIASDMPLGLIVGDGRSDFEAVANGDGPALGRELEIAGLLRFLKRHAIRNVVWLTADVHYAAAHHYQPARARFTEFEPFWEFVAGPLHAGTFGPGAMDDTFGPEVVYASSRPGMRQGRGPAEGDQFFGVVRIDRGTRAMTVSLNDIGGRERYRVTLPPV
jgi:alkaline phosphatase D